MQVSSRFITLIEQLEGFKARCYRDTGGRRTVGFGHACIGNEFNDATLTRDEAENLLMHDVKYAENAVNEYVKVPLRQEQFDALVAFTFNVGIGAFANSTLVRKLNAGHCCAVPDELRRWNQDNGKVIAGLIARRKAEISVYVGDA